MSPKKAFKAKHTQKAKAAPAKSAKSPEGSTRSFKPLEGNPDPVTRGNPDPVTRKWPKK